MRWRAPVRHATGSAAGYAVSAPAAASTALSPLVVAGVGQLTGTPLVKDAEEATLKTPEAVEQREASQTKFESLDPEKAAALASETFPVLIDHADGGPPELPPGASISSYPTDTIAQLDLPGGGHAVVESLAPMAMETAPGRREPVDLTPRRSGHSFGALRSPVGMSIGTLPGEGATLTDSGVSLTPLDEHGRPAGGSEGTLDGKSVFYGAVGSDVDEAVKPTISGVEEISILRSARSPERLEFRVGLPAGATLSHDSTGGPEVLDEGQAIARVQRPSAVDAAGTAVPVTMTVSGDVLTLKVARRANQYRYPIAVDPRLEDAGLTGAGAKSTNWHFAQSGSHFTSKGWGESTLFLEPIHSGSWGPGESGFLTYETLGVSKIFAAELNSSGEAQGAIETYMRMAHGTNATEEEDTEALDGPFLRTSYAKATYSLCAAYDASGHKQNSCPEGAGNPWQYAAEHNRVSLVEAVTCTSACNAEGNLQGVDNAALYTAHVFVYQEESATPKVWFNESSPAIYNGQAYVRNPLFSCKFRLGLAPCAASAGLNGDLGPDSGAIEVQAEDPGVGVSSLEVFATNSSFEIKRHYEEEGKCSGVQCPEGIGVPKGPKGEHSIPGETISYNASMPEGEMTIAAHAEDSAGLRAPAALAKVIVDAKPPKITVGGALNGEEIGTGESKLKVEASDGEGATRSAGVSEIKVAIDNHQLGSPQGHCEPGPCTASGEWPIAGRNFAAGKHKLIVTAVDNANNVRKEELPFWVHAASPVGAGPGRLNPSSGELTLSATDVSLGSGLGASRAYDSRHLTLGAEGPLGPQWKLSLGGQETLSELPEGSIVLNGSSGGQTLFVRVGKNEYEAPRGDGNLKLEAKEEGGKITTYLLKDQKAGATTTFTKPSGWAPTPTYATYFGSEGALGGQFKGPVSIATDAEGDIWVSDNGNNRVEEFSSEHVFIRSVGSKGTGEGQFEAPWGVAVNAKAGLLYISDQGNHRIDVFGTSGRYVTSFGAGKGPAFGTLAGVAVDESGNVWVCDYSNNRIDEFSETGEYESTIAPEGAHALNGPTGIALSGGNPYVTNQGNRTVEELNAKGEWQRTFGGEGTGNGQFSDPYGIATDPENGDLFVSDALNHRVQEFSPEGVFLTKFGAAGSEASDFSKPLGIAITTLGAVYVADNERDAIREWEVPQERSVWLPTISEGTRPGDTQTYAYRSAEVEGKQVLEPTEELAPKPGEVECVGRPKEGGNKFNRGCRALFFEYSTGTNAGGENQSEWGEFAGHLKEVIYAAWNPQAEAGKGKIEEVPVARYSYDKLGRLRAEWDPRIERSPLKTTYGYDEEGHVTALTPPGEQPWTFTYGTIAGDVGSGRLIKYARPPATTAPWNGKVVSLNEAECLLVIGWRRFCSLLEGPRLSGSAQVGTRMAISQGVWSNAPVSYAYQWESCNPRGEGCAPIAGANNENYTPRPGDAAHTLRAQITATNGGGSVTVLSEASALVTGMPTPTYSLAIGKEGSEAGQVRSPRSLARDASGHLWVADAGNNRVEELSESGTMIRQITSFKVKSGSSEEEQLANPTGMAVSPRGGVWVLAEVQGLPKLLEFSEGGEYLSQFTYAQHEHELGSGTLAIDPRTGTILVAAGKVFEFTEKGEFIRAIQTCHEEGGVIFGLACIPAYAAAVAVDPAGNVWVADSATRTQVCACWGLDEFSLEGTLMRKVGGNQQWNGTEIGNPGEGPGQFEAPSGIAVDPSGRVWVADTGNHRVQVFGAQGEYLSQFGTKGSASGQFEEPVGIAFAPGGEAWALDRHNDNIERWTPGAAPTEAAPDSPEEGSTIEYDVPVSGSAAAHVGAGFHADGFSILGPTSMTTDTQGDVWAVGLGFSANPPGLIRESNAQGQLLHEIATGTCLPSNISADRTGDVWVSEMLCARIQEYNSEGKLLRQLAATGEHEGELSFPAAVASDSKGHVYDVNGLSRQARVWEEGENGGFVRQFGEAGSGAGQFSQARGIAAEEDGNIWIADSANNRLDEFGSTGAFIKAVGFGVADGRHQAETCTSASGCRAGIAGSGDGELSQPTSVALDSHGHVFAADSENARVQEFASESGAYLGQFGQRGSAAGGLTTPVSVSLAPSGSLWVLDETSAQIAEYQLSQGPTGAPHALGQAEVAAWAQRPGAAPVEATATFPPDERQSYPATDYRRAAISYMDSRGRIVNSAAPSGGISTSEYNEDNEVVRSLSADNRLAALEAGSKSVEVSEHLDTESTYNFEGTELLKTLGPEHSVKLAAKLGSHQAGEEVKARNRAVYGYDEGHPAGEEYGLETKVIQGLELASGETGEERETTTSYEGTGTEKKNLGWELREPTSVTTDPKGLRLTTTTLYDEQTGRPIETRAPEGQGGESGAPAFTYLRQFGSEGTGAGEFKGPIETALDAQDNVWVSDFGNNRVDELSAQGAFKLAIGWGVNKSGTAKLETCTSECKAGIAGAEAGEFHGPGGLAINKPTGKIYVSDYYNNRVIRLSTSGSYEGSFGATGSEAGKFNGPEGIAVDSSGNVWVLDNANNRVEEFSAQGEFKQALGWGVNKNGTAKLETCTSECKAGMRGGEAGEFSEPTDLAFSGANLYVTDSANHRVQELTPAGTYVTQFGSSTLSYPEGIATDSGGNLYVVDHNKADVVEFSPTGQVRTTFGAEGSANGDLKTPVGIALDEAGDAYVADEGNDRVEAFRPVTPAVHDQKTVYYTQEANSEHPTCGGHPEWEGLACMTLPAKQPGTSGLPPLPETTVTYNIWDEPVRSEEAFGAAKRIKATTYDAAGRETASEVSLTGASGLKAVPKITKAYNEATGALEVQRSEGEAISALYNSLGELERYTDANGFISTYEYDVDGRGTLVKEGMEKEGAEPKDKQTYAYDPTTGALTELIDSTAGVFKASYDAEAKLESETYPNGMIATYTYSAAGAATALSYEKPNCSSACTIYSDQLASSIHGEALAEQTTLEQMSYAYDSIGRLTQAQETPAGKGCTTRIYAYDAESNRTNLTTRESATSQCATNGGSVEAHGYDEANRLTDAGVSYDELGNPLKTPASDAGGQELQSTYYADSQLSTQKQSEKQGEALVQKEIEYRYDPAGRTQLTVTSAGTKSEAISHYIGPAATPAWTAEAGNYTINVAGIDGSLSALAKSAESAKLQLHDLKGDIVGTTGATPGEYTLLSTYNSTEFGVPSKEKPLPASGLAWLGAAGVKSELASGVVSEGGSSYVPEIGRVLQTDAIVPPGAYAEGSYTGAPYITHLSAETIAGEAAYGAGAPGRAAQREEEARRKEEEEAERACNASEGESPACGDPESGRNVFGCHVWASWSQVVLVAIGHFKCAATPAIFELQISIELVLYGGVEGGQYRPLKTETKQFHNAETGRHGIHNELNAYVETCTAHKFYRAVVHGKVFWFVHTGFGRGEWRSPWMAWALDHRLWECVNRGDPMGPAEDPVGGDPTGSEG
jgi:DNA-binding beta-propeller fold protein YncE